MRAILAIPTLAAILFVTPAQAEKHIFIVASNADGYGVDRCLSNGANCGNAAAMSYCRSHEFSQAVSFHKIDRDDITGAIPTTGGSECHGATCDQYVAIECSR